MEENFKNFGEYGFLGVELKNKIVRIYGDDGYCLETLSTAEEVQKLIDFLEECKKGME